MLNVEYWMLNFGYWIWILNLNIEFYYWIWVLNLNVEFECWKLNVKWGWVRSERLWLYFQVVGIRCFSFRGCADTDGLRAGCFGCSWILLPADGGKIPSSRHNGSIFCHCLMYIFFCIRLDLLTLLKYKVPGRVGNDFLEEWELISEILSSPILGMRKRLLYDRVFW